MRKLLTFLIALVTIVFGAYAATAQMSLTGAGGTRVRPAAPTYQGPGDVKAGATFWYGLRGYTAAYAAPGTNPAVDLVDQAGANPVTIKILSNGNLDTASISAWVTAHSVTTINVAKLYDQTGNGWDVTQGTLANMPTLGLNTLGSHPAVVFTSPTVQTMANTSLTGAASSAQSVSAVYERVGTSLGVLFGFNGISLLGANAAATGLYQPNGSMTFSISDNAVHAVQATVVPGTGTVYVDSAAPQTGSVSPNVNNQDQLGNGLFVWNGPLFELGYWDTVSISGTEAANLYANQHSYWGF